MYYLYGMHTDREEFVMIILLIWLWPISGIIIGIAFALRKTKGDNDMLRFIGVCLGFLAGIVLGPFAISLFFEGNGDSKGSAG